MARLEVIGGVPKTPDLREGVLMIHKNEPPMVVIVDEVTGGGEGFWGTDLETGIRIEYDAGQFVPFIGKLTLEQ
jgi:hypothetical protein